MRAFNTARLLRVYGPLTPSFIRLMDRIDCYSVATGPTIEARLNGDLYCYLEINDTRHHMQGLNRCWALVRSDPPVARGSLRILCRRSSA